jgi:hypothetical protein
LNDALRTLRCGHYIFELGELDAYIYTVIVLYTHVQIIMESFQVTYNTTTVYCHGTISFVRHMLLSAKSCFHVCFDNLPLKPGVLIIPTKCSKCKTLSNRMVYKHDTFFAAQPESLPESMHNKYCTFERYYCQQKIIYFAL